MAVCHSSSELCVVNGCEYSVFNKSRAAQGGMSQEFSMPKECVVTLTPKLQRAAESSRHGHEQSGSRLCARAFYRNWCVYWTGSEFNLRRERESFAGIVFVYIICFSDFPDIVWLLMWAEARRSSVCERSWWMPQVLLECNRLRAHPSTFISLISCN